ncbi:MAG: hypothetical protein D6797_04145 [Bdellovibrio sp.]|nr:MAG: hypothetical protein D6797_04145 [Bdellovibrio sp.]
MSFLGALLLIVIPLLAFAIMESLLPVRKALIGAGVVAFVEFSFSYFYFKEVDSFSWFSLFLLLVFISVAYLKDSRRVFYFKPSLLSFAFGGFLLVSHWLGHDVLLEGIEKYSRLLPEDKYLLFQTPQMRNLFQMTGVTVGWAFVMHAIIAAWAAWKLNRWWWFFIAGLGSYVFMLGGMIVAFVLVS